jgi:hypothetical protein
MARSLPFRPLVTAGAAALALIAVLADAPAPAPVERPRDIRQARKARLAMLERALPGQGGEAPRGPASADEEAFLQRAYPDSDIPAVRRTRSRQSFFSFHRHGRRFGRRRPGVWSSLGPLNAIYQRTDLRLTYVPNEYAASGRVTALAMGPRCSFLSCTLYVAAAGGGVWKTDRGLDRFPRWQFLTEDIGINAVGTIVVDPNDPSGRTLWVGTGEANASGDSAAGVGLYKSTNGGRTWSGPLGASAFNNRSVGSIAVDPTNPNVVYAASTRGVRGVASTTGGAISLIPGAPAWGLYKTTDGGATWTFLHNGSANAAECTDPVVVAGGATACSLRGVRRVALDPSDPNVVYAGSYSRGVWRSSDGGATWAQIKAPLGTDANMRPEIAVTSLPNGNTRMYVGEGTSGSPTARLFRSDDANLAAPTFTNLTSPDPADPGFGSHDYCTGQCWYDNLVYTPPGHPDVVYVGGSYQYGEDLNISNGRALVLSTDAGVSFTDLTKDATDDVHPNGLHPDLHALVTHPANPFQFWNGSDGGVMRSSGQHTDVSERCDTRGLAEPALSRCRQLLSRVPTRLTSVNHFLPTLQFQSLSVSPFDHRNIQGGTQDNGTFETDGSRAVWPQTMWGDGGQSGFDVANRRFRFHTYFNAFIDVNFRGGITEDWNWVSDRLTVEPQAFYPPVISDPRNSRWMWAGLSHVWRTKTHGVGPRTIDEFRAICNEFTGSFTDFCGDWEPLAAPYTPPVFPNLTAPPASTRLTASGALYGTDRAGGTVRSVERGRDDATLWAATSTGRVFVSKNAHAEPASAVVFARIDPLSAADPNRFVSGIHVDPRNPNRAWLSYSGYSATTPTTPGHVFKVEYDPVAGTATWTLLDTLGAWPLPDTPATDVVRDPFTGDLYVSTDFGVVRWDDDASSWAMASDGMPNVEVAHLTILPFVRKLYAATHGLGAWQMTLP